MRKFAAQLRLLVALFVLLAGGCAPAYHCYSGCRVNCRYCVPRPLPHCQYNACVCHSCAASKYLVPANNGAEPILDEVEKVVKERVAEARVRAGKL